MINKTNCMSKVNRKLKMDPSNYSNFNSYYHPGFVDNNTSLNNPFGNTYRPQQVDFTAAHQQNASSFTAEDWRVANPSYASSSMTDHSALLPTTNAGLTGTTGSTNTNPNTNEHFSWQELSELISPAASNSIAVSAADQSYANAYFNNNAQSNRLMRTEQAAQSSSHASSSNPYNASYYQNSVQPTTSSFGSTNSRRENISNIVQQIITSKTGHMMMPFSQQAPFSTPTAYLDQFARGASNFPNSFAYNLAKDTKQYYHPEADARQSRNFEKNPGGVGSGVEGSILNIPNAKMSFPLPAHQHQPQLPQHFQPDIRQLASCRMEEGKGGGSSAENNIQSSGSGRKRKRDRPSKDGKHHTTTDPAFIDSGPVDFANYSRNSMKTEINVPSFEVINPGVDLSKVSASNVMNYQSNQSNIHQHHQQQPSTSTSNNNRSPHKEGGKSKGGGGGKGGKKEKSGKKRSTSNADGPECTVCQRRFYDKTTLKRHQINVHKLTMPIASPRNANPAGPECQICKKRFYDRTTLKRHELNVHILKKSQPRPTKVVAKNPNPNGPKCTICGKSFYDKGNVRRHMASVHDKQKSRNNGAMCTICDRAFYDQSNLRRHLATVHKITELPLTNLDQKPAIGIGIGGSVTEERSRIDADIDYALSRTLECTLCRLFFQGENVLKKHIKEAHAKELGGSGGSGVHDDGRAAASSAEGSPFSSTSNSFDENLYEKYKLKQLKNPSSNRSDNGDDAIVNNDENEPQESAINLTSDSLQASSCSMNNSNEAECGSLQSDSDSAVATPIPVPLKEEINLDVPYSLSSSNQNQRDLQQVSSVLDSCLDQVVKTEVDEVTTPGEDEEVKLNIKNDDSNVPDGDNNFDSKHSILTMMMNSTTTSNGLGHSASTNEDVINLIPGPSQGPALGLSSSSSSSGSSGNPVTATKKRRIELLVEKCQLVRKTKKSSNDKEIFKCGFCAKVFQTKEKLLNHLLKTHDAAKMNENTKNQNKQLETLKTCYICHQQYQGKHSYTSLSRHMRSKHKEEWKQHRANTKQGRKKKNRQEVNKNGGSGSGDGDDDGGSDDDHHSPADEEDTLGSSTSFEEEDDEGEEGGGSSSDLDLDELNPEDYRKLFLKCLNDLGYEECAVCEEYIEAIEFQSHLSLHEVKCYICGCEGLKLNEEFAEHCSTHNVGGKCEIDGCSFIATSRIDLWEHANIKHSMTYPYICIQCGGSFASNFELVTHGKEVHNNAMVKIEQQQNSL